MEKEIVQETMPGARRRGRPRTAWMDNIKTWTGLPGVLGSAVCFSSGAAKRFSCILEGPDSLSWDFTPGQSSDGLGRIGSHRMGQVRDGRLPLPIRLRLRW